MRWPYHRHLHARPAEMAACRALIRDGSKTFQVVERVLAVADGLYARAGAGIDALTFRCRPAIHAARLLYAEIGAAVARRGFDSVTTRAVVLPRRKAALIARAVRDACRPNRVTHEPPPLTAAAFLIEAVAADRSADRFARSGAVPWGHLGTRWAVILGFLSDPTQHRPPEEPVDDDPLGAATVATPEERSA